MDREFDKIEGNLTFEQSLTKNEIEMFELLAVREEIHNALGVALSQYRESINTTRNKFVGGLVEKYRIPKEQRRHAQYDPISQKILSSFHPNVKGHKIVSSSDAFANLASSLLISLIRDLSKQKGIEKG